MFDKAGINEVEFEHEFGYKPTHLTGSEIQEYILSGGKGFSALKSLLSYRDGGRGGSPDGFSQAAKRRLEVKPIYSKSGTTVGAYE
jgi:hypothetical protein